MKIRRNYLFTAPVMSCMFAEQAAACSASFLEAEVPRKHWT
jgi:hypothetical protein